METLRDLRPGMPQYDSSIRDRQLGKLDLSGLFLPPVYEEEAAPYARLNLLKVGSGISSQRTRG